MVNYSLVILEVKRNDGTSGSSQWSLTCRRLPIALATILGGGKNCHFTFLLHVHAAVNLNDLSSDTAGMVAGKAGGFGFRYKDTTKCK